MLTPAYSEGGYCAATKMHIIWLKGLDRGNQVTVIATFNQFLERRAPLETAGINSKSLSFTRKCLKSEKFCNWFPTGVSTRDGSHFLESEAITKRLRNSAIPYMTRLLNQKN